MHLRLVAFATAAQAFGSAERDWELPDGSSVDDLVRDLTARHPNLMARLPRLAIAVDGELAAGSQRLRDGCEVALLPPVSGG